MAIELATVPSRQTAASPPRTRGLAWPRRRVTTRDRAFFTERLALLLETGTPLHASLDAVADQLENPAHREVVVRLREDVAAGQRFSEALARHPRVFSAAYVNLIGASEQGGFMPDVLKRLMEMEDKQAELRSTLVSAFTYPAFLLAFSLAVVIFVLTVVFPKFAELFISIADQLPVTTVVLMAVSDLLRQYWVPLTAGAGAAGYLAHRWLTSPGGRARVDGIKLSLPVIRDVFAQLYLAQLMRVMGLSLDHGVSVLDALKASREVVENRRFTAFLDKVEGEITAGRGLAVGFQAEAFVPPLVKQMLGTGEESGKLPLVMNRIADFYEQELTKRLTMLSKMVEPIMLLVMGVVVGVIVSSLILPIFKIARTVQ